MTAARRPAAGPRPPLSVATRSVERAGLAFLNGLDHFMRRPEDVVEPEPYDVVFRQGKLVLRSYRPARPETIELGTEDVLSGDPPVGLPVLLIPPLMIRPLVYDLREGHSLVGTLRAAGLHPYVVDFGNPEADEQGLLLDDYVLRWLPEVLDAIRADSGRDDHAMLGYCMGGLFALMVAATDPRPGLRGIVTIGAPIDSRKMGLLSLLTRVAHGPVDAIAARLGNVPGGLSSTAFKALTPIRTVTRKADLFLNLWDEEWVKGHESLEAWVGGFLDYPRDAFRQFFREFMRDNALLEGTMEVGGQRLDLGRITCPVLVFAGTDDRIVPVPAARAALGALGAADVRFREVPGGHMGIVAGFRARSTVWEPSRRFLLELARA